MRNIFFNGVSGIVFGQAIILPVLGHPLRGYASLALCVGLLWVRVILLEARK